MPKATKVKHPARTVDAQPAPRPRSVKVGFLEYVIIWMDDKVWRGDDDRDNSAIGEHVVVQGNIFMRLVPDVHEDYYRETLVHEILHACWAMADLNEKPVAADEDQEETIIARVSNVLISVLKDNPDVVAYLGAQLWKVKVRG